MLGDVLARCGVPVSSIRETAEECVDCAPLDLNQQPHLGEGCALLECVCVGASDSEDAGLSEDAQDFS